MDISRTNIHERCLTWRAGPMEKAGWGLQEHHEWNCTQPSCHWVVKYCRISWDFVNNNGSVVKMPKSIEWLLVVKKKQIPKVLFSGRRWYALDPRAVPKPLHHSTSSKKIVLRDPYCQIYWWTRQDPVYAIASERGSASAWVDRSKWGSLKLAWRTK